MKNPLSNSRTFHLLSGGTAAVLALTAVKKSKWRYPLLALAGLEMWNGFTATTGETENIPFESAPVTSKTAMVNGIQMRWEEHGDTSENSVPVIMVHGLPTNPRVWRYIIPKVAGKGVRCLAWEQVGFGESMLEGLGMDISLIQQAEYLYNWLQELGISKAIFVAHDFGGGVVQQLLVNHPELAAGLVLSDAVAYDNWPVTAVRAARSMSGAIEHLPTSMIKPFLYAGVSNLGHENKAIKEESFQLYWEPYNNSFGPKAFAHQLRHFHSEDSEHASHRFEQKEWNIPARVVWGKKDPLGVASGERLAKALNTSLITIPGGRHFTIEDHPEVIATAVKEVLTKVRGLS
ncbi:alpha/beta fold hydrolase [Nafulsella turpanensis]|uniref:alpha/beta fold hydrolase n=1 Tax=Nafulsella turpanensis TaxID=1265690 RepID=UPI000344FF2F|nr:alpha/beta hydrolase [Nafulsella turpanensis]